MSKTTSGRHAAAKTTFLKRIRAALDRRAAQYDAWASTNTELKGIS